MDPHQKFTVLGSCSTPRKVDQIWIVESSQNTQSGSLVDRAKQRMNTRASPSFLHYDDYKKARQSCWIIEESGGDFFCDCPVCMKVKYSLNAACANLHINFRVSLESTQLGWLTGRDTCKLLQRSDLFLWEQNARGEDQRRLDIV